MPKGARPRNEQLQKAVGQLIRTMRLEQQMTTELFEMKTGLNYHRLESGNYNLTIATVETVCEAFGLTLGAFFSRLDAYYSRGEER